jgi:transposase
LRLIGLGLVVSVDGGVPLVSHAYPGNLPDVTQFPLMVGELASRFQSLVAGQPGAGPAPLTLVFDAGQNSEDNYAIFAGENPLFHFVGSLPPSDHPDLLAVPTKDYRPLEAFPGLSAYETRKVVYGVERRIVLTHSERLHAGQSAGFDQTLGKARRQLQAVSARLARGRCRKPKDKVEAEIEAILRPRWVSRVISTTLSGSQPSELRLTYRSNPRARAVLEGEIFGKRILFSDKGPELASSERIVSDYRSQEAAEGDFRQMKDRSVVSFSPMHHFTEQKIRVHVACCVLALMAARLMVREAGRAGISLSVRALLDSLGGIEETVLLYQGERGRPKARRMLTEMDETERQLFELFGLGAYAPTTP